MKAVQKIRELITLHYRKGHFHKALTFAAYLMIAFAASLALAFLCRLVLLGDSVGIISQYIDNQETVAAIRERLAPVSFQSAVLLLGYTALILYLAFFAIRKFAQINFAGQIKLNKAIRFPDAMERLGLLTEPEQSFFLRFQKIPLYIAVDPMTTPEGDSVSATPYVFANTILASDKYLNEHKGQRRLCINMDDFESARTHFYDSLGLNDDKAGDQGTIDSLRRKVMELEQEKRAISGKLVDYSGQITALEEDNTRISKELQAGKMRAGKSEKSERLLSLYSMVFAPMYQKLARKNHDPKDFTREALNDFMCRELDANQILHDQLKIITKLESCNKAPTNVLDAIWGNLREFGLVSLGGAAPGGAKERLRRLFYPGSEK